MSLIPARMLNELVYCPRLFALEHLDGEWADNAHTVRGQTVHRRVDVEGGTLPEPEGDEPEPTVARSVELSDDDLGIVAKIDLVEAADGAVVPVDYKKGRVPRTPAGAWLPERVQVCAQGLLLRAHGYTCDQGVLYFAGSRRRVVVVFDDALTETTVAAVQEARRILAERELPPPLVDSPKCAACSLVGICLPDETNLLAGRAASVRPVAPAHEQGLPLYVVARGAKLSLRGGEIVVKADGEVVDRVRLSDTSRIVVSGAAAVTTPLLAEIGRREIPLAVHSFAGHLLGQFVGASGHNVLGRIEQHRVAADAERALALARSFVQGKILNQRVLLRRNATGDVERALNLLSGFAEDAARAGSLESLYGTEGSAARTYFERLPTMLKGPGLVFDFEKRNRRPPKDPVNAVLSFAYSFLARECANVLQGVGLDAWVGFLHRPRPGKPALALDLMEEFRPVIAESSVLNAINNGVLGPDDFIVRAVGASMTDGARKRFIRVFERRMAEEATHPLFGTKMSYRRILEVQARLIAKVLRGDIPRYEPFRIR